MGSSEEIRHHFLTGIVMKHEVAIPLHSKEEHHQQEWFDQVLNGSQLVVIQSLQVCCLVLDTIILRVRVVGLMVSVI